LGGTVGARRQATGQGRGQGSAQGQGRAQGAAGAQALAPKDRRGALRGGGAAVRRHEPRPLAADPGAANGERSGRGRPPGHPPLTAAALAAVRTRPGMAPGFLAGAGRAVGGPPRAL